MQTSDSPQLTADSRFKTAARLVALASVVAAIVFWSTKHFEFDSDSSHYIALAQGRVSEVIKPFTNRILHPLAAALFGYVFHLNTSQSFLLMALFSLAVFMSFLSSMTREKLPPWAIGSLLLSPFLLLSLRDYYLPDFFHAALLAGFFLCLYREKPGLALLPLFLLHLTREATLLLTLVVVGVGLVRRKWHWVAGSAGVAAVAMTMTKYAASLGRPNVHNMNDLLYTALKIPYNLMKNCFGCVLWTDSLAANNPAAFPGQPLLKVPVPSFLPIGSIHAVGIHSVEVAQVILTLSLLLMTFGVLPTLVLSDVKRWRKKLLQESPLYVLVALIYGLISYFLGPCLGSSVGRLIGYGWPCFLIAAPFLLRQYHALDSKFLVSLFACHVVASWVPHLLAAQREKSLAWSVVVLALLLALHGSTWRRVRGSMLAATPAT